MVPISQWQVFVHHANSGALTQTLSTHIFGHPTQWEGRINDVLIGTWTGLCYRSQQGTTEFVNSWKTQCHGADMKRNVLSCYLYPAQIHVKFIDMIYSISNLMTYLQCRRKTFMVHQTFVQWALYILFKFVKSLIRYLGPAINKKQKWININKEKSAPILSLILTFCWIMCRLHGADEIIPLPCLWYKAVHLVVQMPSFVTGALFTVVV